MPVFLINDPKCVLIHIPKTGGSAIRDGYFRGQYEGPSFGCIPETWQAYFKFAFVRNPFDRFVSAWKMFSEGVLNSDWKYPRRGRPGMDLNEFLQIAIDSTIEYSAGTKTFEQRIRNHTMPQTHPLACLSEADFVGRFENLEKDFARVCEHLGLVDKNLPLVHNTRRGQYPDYIDQPSREALENFYSADLAKLGYSFEDARLSTDSCPRSDAGR